MSKMLYKIIKRIFDILISLILLIIVSPLLAFISFGVWTTDGGEVFLRDPLRLGKDNKYFRMYKFRTMIPNAHRVIQNDPKYSKLKELWEEPGRKLSVDEDIRITKIGKLLRKTDLDELPQLINVLVGDMSLVGPRPMYKEEMEKYFRKHKRDKHYLKDIVKIKPGITGIWQVSGRNEINFTDRLKMDSKYAKNINLLTDIKVLLKTPLVVITRRGAYE